jgi:hypothetical protein
MVTKREMPLFLVFAGVPVAALWIYQGLQAAHDYAGTCGLLDAGWACSKAQYVELALSSAFVFPFLAAVSIGWLIVVAAATLMYSRLRKRRGSA